MRTRQEQLCIHVRRTFSFAAKRCVQTGKPRTGASETRTTVPTFAAAAQLQLGPQLSLQSPLQPQPSTRRVAFSAPPKGAACAHGTTQACQGSRPQARISGVQSAATHISIPTVNAQCESVYNMLSAGDAGCPQACLEHPPSRSPAFFSELLPQEAAKRD